MNERLGNYFGKKQKGFHNSIWIELIGFDKNAKDYGVGEYLKTIGFIPDCFSFHLTSIDFAHMHEGMEKEYIIPTYSLSYGGHLSNGQRERQDWTNYDLKGLIDTLHSYGIKVLAGMFEVRGCHYPEAKDSPCLCHLHPELLHDSAGSFGYFMIKRFADGTYYENFLIEKLIKIKKDFGFDGFQLADGISSPRCNIFHADFSDDVIEQSGIKIPEGETPRDYILNHARKDWISFYRRRWGEFLYKTVTALKNEGAIVGVNSAWTRDPLEAIYRYGTDYSYIEKAGADFFIAEDVSSDLAILESDSLTYEDRKLVHYEFIANLMAINAYMSTHITPLFMLWDNREQWDVIHHMPTALQRAAAGNFSHFSYRNDKLTAITGGPHFCLGDALSEDDWSFIRHSIDNAFTPCAADTAGATFIWSNARMEAELEEFLDYSRCHSIRILAYLLRNGAQIGKIADISKLPILNGDIVVTNFDLLPSKEKALINNYKNGKIIKISSPKGEKADIPLNGWTCPLNFKAVPQEEIKRAIREINENSDIKLISGTEQCKLHEVIIDDTHSKIFIENNEYYYVIPKISSKRDIKAINIITKLPHYPSKLTQNGFQVRVAGRGVEIIEIEFAGKK